MAEASKKNRHKEKAQNSRQRPTKRGLVIFRVTPERRKELELLAESSGRSLSQELELRLEQSFNWEKAYGGSELAALFRAMGAAATLIESRRKRGPTLDDLETFLAVQVAWSRLMSEWAPSPAKTMRAELDELVAQIEQTIDQFKLQLETETKKAKPKQPESVSAEGTLFGDEDDAESSERAQKMPRRRPVTSKSHRLILGLQDLAARLESLRSLGAENASKATPRRHTSK